MIDVLVVSVNECSWQSDSEVVVQWAKYKERSDIEGDEGVRKLDWAHGGYNEWKFIKCKVWIKVGCGLLRACSGLLNSQKG